jgi:hypothetical protein
MTGNAECTRDATDAGRVHIIGEDERDLILAVRIEKSLLTANLNFITALFELANLLDPLSR